MKVLVACEESQTVCKAFRSKGHEAYSCDTQDCSGGKPEWHIKNDAVKVAYNNKWDIMIAHPPCTYLSITGNSWYNIEKYGEKAIQRHRNREEAIKFFTKLWEAPIKKICIENPVGIMAKYIGKHTQIIHPYYFGDPHQKQTCLWLKNLKPLFHLEENDLFNKKTHVDKGDFFCWVDKKTGKKKKQPLWYYKAKKDDLYSKRRSKLFNGIAEAMANQWE